MWPHRIWKPVFALLAVAFATGAGPAAQPSIAERLDRSERLLDWPAVEALSRRFVLESRADAYAITSVLNGCIARGCDEAAVVAGLHGPLVSDGVREFARAWLEYAARNPAAARERFEALSREAETAWLGIFGRLAYAADARNAALLREAMADARSNADVASVLAEDLRTSELILASLEGDDERGAALAKEGGETAGALMARFSYQLAAADFAAAEQTIARYASLWGDDQDAAVSRIELARAQHPPEEVAVLARRALTKYPRFWKLRFELAQALIESDEDAAARAVLAKGLPTAFAEVRLELAVVRTSFQSVRGDEVDAYAKELEPWRDYPDAQAAVASALVETGRAQDAVPYLDRADAMTEALPATLGVRARLAGEAGEADEYLRLLERVATRSPGDVNAQLVLGFAYAEAGESVKAARVAAALRHSRRYVRPDKIESLEKAAREAAPGFRTADAGRRLQGPR
jgi:predicted Zn-dependent protease